MNLNILQESNRRLQNMKFVGEHGDDSQKQTKNKKPCSTP